MTFPIDLNCWNYSLRKTYKRLKKTWGITDVFPYDERCIEYLNKQEEKYFSHPVCKLVYDELTEHWVEPETL